MSAASNTLISTEIVSPELVLIDPGLAVYARGLLLGPDDKRARRLERSAPAEEDERAEALHRITELSEVVPPKVHGHRLMGLVSVTAASSAVALFVADLQLGLYAWPGWLPH